MFRCARIDLDMLILYLKTAQREPELVVFLDGLSQEHAGLVDIELSNNDGVLAANFVRQLELLGERFAWIAENASSELFPVITEADCQP